MLSRSLHALRPLKGDKVIIAMSGGVDSSVVAGLLAREGKYDLEGVFMRNWDTSDESGSEKEGGCAWEKDWVDVQRVCGKLGIRARMVDLSKEYWTRVFEPSLRAWEKGWTPNPDVWCNKEVKFGALLDRITHHSDPNSNKAPWLATGHYVRKDYHLSSPLSQPLPRLLRHPSPKDQSYYLSSIPLSALRRAIFPLGNPPKVRDLELDLCSPDSPSSSSSASIPTPENDSPIAQDVREQAREEEPPQPALTKPQVRSLAHKWGLHTASREESMGICFVGEKKRFGEFVSQYIPPTAGPIIALPSRARIGTHTGLWNYTLGQKARIGGCAERMYVVGKDKDWEGGAGAVWVATGDHPLLYTRSLTSTNFTWIWPQAPDAIWNSSPFGSDGGGDGLKATVKIRHVGEPVEAFVTASPEQTARPKDPANIRITFKEPQKAVTPGQIAVVYDESGEWCLGCGVIEDHGKNEGLVG